MNLFSKKKSGEKNNKVSRSMILLITAICCIAAILIAFNLSPETKIDLEEKEEVKRIVSVENLIPTENTAKINLLGEAVPEWQTIIKSRVDGIITNISPKFRVGSNIKKGEILMEVENSQYWAIVADAEVRLSNAKHAFLVEENEASEAKDNWKRSGFEGEPESPLVFRTPQLETAKNEVDAAEALLVKAKIDLEFTKVKAPFDGSIVERNVNLGESIFPGESIAMFINTSKILVKINVDQNQWNLLPQNINNVSVKLKNSESGNTWKAKIARTGDWLISTSRLRPIIIEVNNKLNDKNPLLAGTFLNVELSGQRIAKTIGITESALTKGGFVWFVKNDSTLESYKPTPHFYSNGKAFISSPADSIGIVRVAVNPNSTFMNGFKVKPQNVITGE